jgi:hypothetical protein
LKEEYPQLHEFIMKNSNDFNKYLKGENNALSTLIDNHRNKFI